MIQVDISQKLEQELEERRKEALIVAEKCINLLKRDFGAREAFICGSLAGENPWHWHSDLDLAVLGLSQDRVWDAHTALESLTPNWLEVDLIPLEFAPKHLRDRILNKIPMTKNKYLDLKIRIEDEMNSLKITVDTLNRALAEMAEVSEIFVAPALASYVVDFYTGCERISERVAVYLDGGVPRTENWHLELLKQMAEPGGCDRPPLWSGALLLDLSEYRKFRHLRQHNYDIKLKSERVIALAQQVLPVYEQIKLAIDDFFRWLDEKGEGVFNSE